MLDRYSHTGKGCCGSYPGLDGRRRMVPGNSVVAEAVAAGHPHHESAEVEAEAAENLALGILEIAQWEAEAAEEQTRTCCAVAATWAEAGPDEEHQE